ncbi:hypothetical protein [Altererythrobacter fulvus]|uniref:beta strand repeat-containing protein n=1 Tax=Caenibius fulvus TaxID=2126012 RepID=UPI00301AFD7C
MTKISDKGRNQLLATVGTAMAATMMVTGAHAAETVVTPVLPGPLTVDTDVNGHDIIDAVLNNVAAINATITGTTGGVGLEETSTTTTSVTVDGNDILGTAIGNSFDNEIDLSVLENDIVSDGAAALGFETNTGSITATIQDNDIILSIPNFQTGSATVSGNDIEGRATGNAGSTTLEGIVPNTYSSGQSGNSLVQSGAVLGDWLDADGSVVASTIQINGNPDIQSDVDNNNISLELESTIDGNVVTAAPSVEDNMIASNAKGNSSNSTISLLSGGSPEFTGSLVLTNGQTNVDTSGNGLIEADNLDSDIFGVIEGYDYNYVNTLDGSLSIDGNAITASASGNDALGSNGAAGNRILLADGLSFQGLGGVATSSTAYTSGTVSGNVAADVVIHSSQGNVGASNGNRTLVQAEVDDGNIYGDVESLETGSVSVTDNEVSATARGNAASSSFATGDGSAYFNGTVAVSNQQTNLYTNVEAYNDSADASSDVGYDDGLLEDSTVLVDGNRIASAAYGNLVSQNVALEAVTTAMPDDRVNLTGGTGLDGNVSAEGNVIVTSLQSQYSANVLSEVIDGEIYAYSGADETIDSSISVTGNTQEAIALGNSASNGLALSGTTVETGAGIANVQIVADASSVQAVSEAETYVDVSSDISGSTAETSGNLQRSIAYGGSAGNSLSVDAQTITVSSDVDELASLITVDAAATDGFALDFTNAPDVDAAYGVLNVQSVSALVSAVAVGYDEDSAFDTYVGNDADGSTIKTDSNSLVAAAYGTDANNQAALDVGTLNATEDDVLGQPDFATVMNVTNAQTVTEDSAIVAGATGDETFETYIDGYVDDSSVSTSGNTAQALAYGNRASSGVTVTATNIDTEADSFPGGIRGIAEVDGNQISTDASFSVNSAQFAGGQIVATLLDDVVAPDYSAEAFTYVWEEVTDSSVVSNGNVLTAGATGNRADNLVDLSGNTLATTSALTNYQQSEADIQALIGIAGSPGTPFIPGTPDTPGYNASNSGSSSQGTLTTSNGGNTLNITGSITVTFTTPLTQREADALNAISGVSGATAGGTTVTMTGAVDATLFSSLIVASGGGGNGTGDETFTVAGFAVPLIPGTPDTPAVPRTPNTGGVTVALDSSVDASTISVDDNSVAGSVTGNSASNSVKVDGTSVPDGSDHFQVTAIADGTDTSAAGDHMLTNVQVVGDTQLTSEVYSTFAIDMTDGANIDDSTLTVDGNSQSSRAVANTAANSVELSATNTDAGAVLASNQFSEAEVSALSNVEIYAPVSSDNTSVSLSDNSNLALAVVNNVSNSLTIEGTNVYPNVIARDVLLDVDSDVYGGGDGILLNQQIAQTSATATAVTNIYNEDGTYLTTDGVVDGSVKITGNSTTAEASANRAVNVADASAGSSLGASVGIVNAQNSIADVTANATTNAGVVIAGDDVLDAAALNGSSVTLGTNTTASLARGNSATNALNYSAGANYGDVDLLAGTGAYTVTTSGNVATSARAAVLNVQGNSGAVSANSTQTTYVVALNSQLGEPAVTNATVGVIGNAVSAAAYGNTATNSVTVAALNTNAPTVAIGNVQNNSGPVSATVTTVTYGVNGGYGAIAGSAISVTNNAVTATAVGNNAVNAIIGN